MSPGDKIGTLSKDDYEYLRQLAMDNFRAYVAKDESAQKVFLDQVLQDPRLIRYQEVVVTEQFRKFIRKMTSHIIHKYDDTKSSKSSSASSSVNSGASSLVKLKTVATANATFIAQEYIEVMMTGKKAGGRVFGRIVALLEEAKKEAEEESAENAKNQAMVNSRKRKTLEEELARFFAERESSSQVRARVTEWVISQQQTKNMIFFKVADPTRASVSGIEPKKSKK